jgi:CPA1 family monovalent cation:H+ antiporter
MQAFEIILVMLGGAVLLLGLARRTGLPFPVLLALAGVLLAVAPFDVPLAIDPALVLALLVAPILLDTAYDTSPRDLKANWRPVLGLVVIAVGLTTATVAGIVHWLVPGIPWAAAIALGAIVAPPDAAAAAAVLRQVNPPHRINVILQGESLLNDASSLLIYRLALGAVASGGTISAAVVAPAFLLSVGGSLIAGPVLALLWQRLSRLFDDAPSSIILQFVGTFGVWVLAEAIGLSAILTVVAYAMTVAHYAPATTPARLRVPSYAVWETVVVVLTALAFVLIGLQLGPVIARASAAELARWSVIAGAVLAAVIAIRLLWVMGYNRWLWWRGQRVADGTTADWRGGLIIGWSGMRGIVTVATALALPAGFPERDLLLFTAFTVTLGTLVLQGLSLKPLVQWLGTRDDDPVAREVRLARVALAEAGIASLDGNDDRAAVELRAELETERDAADTDEGDGRAVLPALELRAQVLETRRKRLLALREDGTIGDDAFHRIEEELDFADLAAAQRA